MRHNRYEPKSTMNITSLLDVTFMLLIMFIIATPVMNAQIDLSLPESKSVDYTDEESIDVSIDEDGKVYIGKTNVEWQRLTKELQLLKQSKGINSVALRGAAKVEYEVIMRAVDAIKEADINNLGLVALPKKK
ncbi:MAG: ExbD/TolR family protein [Candidatus Zixiibacteriota bacterium]